MATITWLNTIPEEFQENIFADQFQRESEEAYIAMSSSAASRRTSATEASTETADTPVTDNSGNEATETVHPATYKRSSKRKTTDDVTTKKPPAKRTKKTKPSPYRSIEEIRKDVEDGKKLEQQKQQAVDESKKRKAADDAEAESSLAKKMKTDEDGTDEVAQNTEFNNTATKQTSMQPSDKQKAGGAQATTKESSTQEQEDAATDADKAVNSGTEIVETTTAQQETPAKKTRKRKASIETPTTPRAKRIRWKTAKAEEATKDETPSRAKRTRKTPCEEQTMNMQPPPPPRAKVSQGVEAKLVQVHGFIKAHPELKLDREPDTTEHITLYERNLQGVVQAMYCRYELASQPAVPLTEIENAVIVRLEDELIAIDLAKLTKLEEQIQEKITRHGLEDKNLLKIEIEMFYESLERDSTTCFRAQVASLLDAVATTNDANDMQILGDASEIESMNDEGGRLLGVCPRPMKVVS